MDDHHLHGAETKTVLDMLGFETTRIARWATAILVVAAGALSSANAASLAGTVQSGGTSTTVPLAKVKVTLYEATTKSPSIVGQATTDTAGHFVINPPKGKDSKKGIFFAQADLGGGVVLIAILGPTLPPNIVINELTTVAGAYSMAQFYRTGEISGDPFALEIAALMNDNLVAVATGTPSAVLLASPNADETNSLRTTRALANLLAACAANPAVAKSLLALTRRPGGRAPTTTPEALANLAREPGLNVTTIDALTRIVQPYLPSLVAVPDAWTVTVKVNDSGDDNYLIGGLANIAFDADGYAWITDNVVQGTPYSSRILVVLQPNGKPADGSNGTARSPIMGGGLLGAGFGITIDPKGSVWVGNFGWGPRRDETCEYFPSPECTGSVSEFAPSGKAVSGPAGYQGGPDRVQGMASDEDGNIWMASYGDNAVYVFLKGNPKKVARFREYPGCQPFDVQIAADGSAWASCGGGFSGQFPSALSRLKLTNGKLRRKAFIRFGDAIKGLSLDSRGNAWVASQKDDKIYVVDPNGTMIGNFGGGGINGPWSTTIDGEDNVWVANFGPLTLPTNETYKARLSKLAGANPATRPPGLRLGDPISPSTGYTVPSAGHEVLLHNGDPLYGPDALPSFDPMQRTTATGIDSAGNLWTLNNWKNNFAIDNTTNPGGDGVVIFVGIAAPPRRGP